MQSHPKSRVVFKKKKSLGPTVSTNWYSHPYSLFVLCKHQSKHGYADAYFKTSFDIRKRKWRTRTYVCQQSHIICATPGSTSSGISSRLFWNPTAPTTCIGFKPFHGILLVVNSHRITPKLYTSHLHANFNYYILNSYTWLSVKRTPMQN